MLTILAIKPLAKNGKAKTHFLECLCDCGNKTLVRMSHVSSGATRSCGCSRARMISENRRTHGMSGTKVHSVWKSILARCKNKKSADWPRYGGRGIAVCNRWEKFENFLSDMGEPKTGQSIDRVDNDKGYVKSNCRWVDVKTQQRNKRNNRVIEYKGVRRCVTEWAEVSNIKVKTLVARIGVMGWNFEKAITTPLQKKKLRTLKK